MSGIRINFNRRTSGSISEYGSIDSPQWLTQLRTDFYNAYDLDEYDSEVDDFVWSVKGAQAFADWLKDEGYNASFWIFDYIHNNRDNEIGYGIHIKDTCQKFTELKLKL